MLGPASRTRFASPAPARRGPDDLEHRAAGRRHAPLRAREQRDQRPRQVDDGGGAPGVSQRPRPPRDQIGGRLSATLRPGPALVGGAVQLARAGPEVHARPGRAGRPPSPRAGRRRRRRAAAGPSPDADPGVAAVVRAPHGRARRRASGGPPRGSVSGMFQTVFGSRGWARHREPELGRQAGGDLLPLPRRRRSSGRRRSGSAGTGARRRRPPSPACGRTGRTPGTRSSGMNSARMPLLRVCQVAPPSARLEHADGRDARPTSASASVGWGTIEWRISPPAPGPHSGRLGWFVRPSTCCQVAPPSVLRNSPAGSTPA